MVKQIRWNWTESPAWLKNSFPESQSRETICWPAKGIGILQLPQLQASLLAQKKVSYFQQICTF